MILHEKLKIATYLRNMNHEKSTNATLSGGKKKKEKKKNTTTLHIHYNLEKFSPQVENDIFPPDIEMPPLN